MNRLVAVALLALFAAPLFAGEVKVGDAAPEIQVKEWLNAPTPLSLAGLSKNVVVVEFWATWCGPCRQSIPHLAKLSETYKSKGVVFMGLTDEPMSKVKKFAADMKMSYPVGTGSKSVQEYGVHGIPTAFVVKDGKVAWAGHPMQPDFEKAIENAVKN
jgi:thiol-disulfide isomerase/thioredoxin